MRMPTGGDDVQDAFHCRTCRHSVSNAETLTIHLTGVNCPRENSNAILEPSGSPSSSPIVRLTDAEAVLGPTPDPAEADQEFASTADTMPGLLILSQRGVGSDHEVHRSRARVMPRLNPSGDDFGPAIDAPGSMKAGPVASGGLTDGQRLAEIAKKRARLQELKLQRANRMASSRDPERDGLVCSLLVDNPPCERYNLEAEHALPSGKVKSHEIPIAKEPASCPLRSSPPPPSCRKPHAALLAIVSLVIPVLLKAFYGLRTHQAGQGSQGSPTASTPYSQRSRNTAGGKRKLSRQQNRGDGQDDGSNSDDEGYSRGKPRGRSSPNSTEQHWACPFCKWKPLAYQSCYAYVLKDISRVKQHLRRRHRIPIHCVICFESFSSEDKRDAHIRARCCQEPPGGPAKMFEGVTREQQEMLERRVNKTKTKSDQWYSIYAILFPGEELPKNPFVDSVVSTHLSAFQDFLAENGTPIIRRIAAEKLPAHLQPQQEDVIASFETMFQHAVPELVRRFEAARGKGKEGADPDSSPPIPDTPAMSLRGSGGETSGESSFSSPPVPFEHDFVSMDNPGGKPLTSMGELRDPTVVPDDIPGGDDGFGYFFDLTYGQLEIPSEPNSFDASLADLE